MAEQSSDLVVRRRAWLMAAVAVASTALAAAYLWHFSTSGVGLELLLGVVLGCIAVGHGRAWTDARHPLLVADATGVRVRLGSQWTGVPWETIERVEIEPRGRVSDGHVAIVVADESAALAEASRRSRLAAALNRRWFDAALVVPFGLTTDVSEPDLAGVLSRLAAGRTPVDVLDGREDEPEPTVEVKPVVPVDTDQVWTEPEPVWTERTVAAESTAPRGDLGHAGEEFAAAGVALTAPAGLPELAGSAESGVLADADDPAGPGTADPAAPHDQPQAKPRRRLFVARASSAALRSVTSLKSQHLSPSHSSARRAEVTIAARGEAVSVGGLALSRPATADPATDLPEIESLRRSSSADEDLHGGAGNVSLIIDATTDLSARAMQRVRRPVETRERRGAVPRPDVGGRGDGDGAAVGTGVGLVHGALVGQYISEARHQLLLSVDDLAERTRIRPYVIESIEADDFSPCGGDFYARGHLRMLARVLGIEAAPLIALYDEHFASSPVNAREVFEVELAHGATGMARASTDGANWGVLIAAVLVLLLVWGVARYVSEQSGPDPSPTTPTQNASGLGSPGPGNKPLPQPTRVEVQVTASGGESRVVVRDRFRTVLFQGRVADGKTKVIAGQAPLRVMAVDGGVVSVSSKGEDLGPVGQAGERSRTVVHANPRRTPH